MKYPVEKFACGIRKRHAMPIMVCNIKLGELKLKYKTEVRFISSGVTRQ
jgi:hypothetical protein